MAACWASGVGGATLALVTALHPRGHWTAAVQCSGAEGSYRSGRKYGLQLDMGQKGCSKEDFYENILTDTGKKYD